MALDRVCALSSEFAKGKQGHNSEISLKCCKWP